LCDLNLKGAENGSGIFAPEDLRRRLLEAAAARGPSQPLFFFMTGDLVDAALTERLAAGGNRIIQKPFRISELAATLTESFIADAAGKRTETLVN